MSKDSAVKSKPICYNLFGGNLIKITDIPKISRLSIAEKILFVEELWDSIASNKRIPVPESHKAELDRRLLKYQNNRGRLLSVKELQKRMEKRK